MLWFVYFVMIVRLCELCPYLSTPLLSPPPPPPPPLLPYSWQYVSGREERRQHLENELENQATLAQLHS